MATNIYQSKGSTSYTWDDAGTGDVNLITLSALGAAGVKVGSYQDMGAAPRPFRYEVEFFIDGFNAAPVVGAIVNLYFTQSNATTGFSGAPTTDPTSSAEGTGTDKQAFNMTQATPCVVHSTTAGDNLKAVGIVELTGRYIAPVVINNTAVALLTAGAHLITLTPIFDQAQ